MLLIYIWLSRFAYGPQPMEHVRISYVDFDEHKVL